MTYDVVSVNQETYEVRVLEENVSLERANRLVEYAVMRRGVETEFFSEAKHGTYSTGDTWKGAD